MSFKARNVAPPLKDKFKDKCFHTKPLLREMNILNVYETKIFQVLCFMFNCKIGITPSVLYRP